MVLEFSVEVTYPVGPALSSIFLWTGGQLFGGIFIIISGAITADKNADPAFNMRNATILHAVIALVAVPSALILGIVGSVERKRLEVDKDGVRRSMQLPPQA